MLIKYTDMFISKRGTAWSLVISVYSFRFQFVSLIQTFHFIWRFHSIKNVSGTKKVKSDCELAKTSTKCVVFLLFTDWYGSHTSILMYVLQVEITIN